MNVLVSPSRRQIKIRNNLSPPSKLFPQEALELEDLREDSHIDELLDILEKEEVDSPSLLEYFWNI
jgi:ribosome assembly protein YihI (activator of Der GTPase)